MQIYSSHVRGLHIICTRMQMGEIGEMFIELIVNSSFIFTITPPVTSRHIHFEWPTIRVYIVCVSAAEYGSTTRRKCARARARHIYDI